MICTEVDILYYSENPVLRIQCINSVKNKSARSFKIDFEIERLSMSGRRQEMPSKPVTGGNSECYYHRVGLCFARALWTGMVDGCNPMTLDPKVACSFAVVPLFQNTCFNPIPNVNPQPFGMNA
jgi:hypothetical protein